MLYLTVSVKLGLAKQYKNKMYKHTKDINLTIYFVSYINIFIIIS